MDVKYNNMEKNDNLCFICLDKIDYYIKLNCECHNYLHHECIKNMLIKKCYICHKENVNKIKLIHNNEIKLIHNNKIKFLVIDFAIDMIEKSNVIYILNHMNLCFINNPCLLTFIIYIIVSMILTFLIIYPLLILLSIICFIKYIKNNDYAKNLMIIIFKNIMILFLTIVVIVECRKKIRYIE